MSDQTKSDDDVQLFPQTSTDLTSRKDLPMDSTLGAVEEPSGPSEPVLATFHAYDREQVDLYAHALGYLVVLDAIENTLWTDWKWAELPPDVFKYVEKLRDKIFELKTENHLPN